MRHFVAKYVSHVWLKNNRTPKTNTENQKRKSHEVLSHTSFCYDIDPRVTLRQWVGEGSCGM